MENNKIKNWVTLIYEDYTNQYDKAPTFRDLIKDCIYIKGMDATDYLSKYIIKGWELNQYPITDFNLEIKELLCSDRDYYYTEMMDYLTNCADKEMEKFANSIKKQELQETNFFEWRERSIKEAYIENRKINVFVKNMYDDYATVFILLPTEFKIPKNGYMEDYYQEIDVSIHNFKNYTQKQFSNADMIKYEFSTLSANIINIDNNKRITLKILE